MQAKAIAKYIKGSPQKARLVVDLIRGLSAEDALNLLSFSKKRAARSITKVLNSAIANAEQKSPAVDPSELVVTEARVDLGPTKFRSRLRPAPMGRAFRQMRRQSHIMIRVSDGKED